MGEARIVPPGDDPPTPGFPRGPHAPGTRVNAAVCAGFTLSRRSAVQFGVMQAAETGADVLLSVRHSCQLGWGTSVSSTTAYTGV